MSSICKLLYLQFPYLRMLCLLVFKELLCIYTSTGILYREILYLYNSVVFCMYYVLCLKLSGSDTQCMNIYYRDSATGGKDQMCRKTILIF